MSTDPIDQTTGGEVVPLRQPLTVAETAEVTGMTSRGVRKACERGDLKATKGDDGRWRIEAGSAAEYRGTAGVVSGTGSTPRSGTRSDKLSAAMRETVQEAIAQDREQRSGSGGISTMVPELDALAAAITELTAQVIESERRATVAAVEAATADQRAAHETAAREEAEQRIEELTERIAVLEARRWWHLLFRRST